MKAKLSSGKKLSRAWRELRENAPVPGHGWMAKQSHHGTTLHQNTFRMGYPPPPDDELTYEQQIQWRDANTVPPALASDPRVTGLGGRAFLPPGKMWPGSKLCVIGRQTARMFTDTACQTDLGTGVAKVSPGAGALNVTPRGDSRVAKGWASPTLRRRGADAARYPRADAAKPTRQRNQGLAAGYGYDRTKTAHGSVLSVARPAGHYLQGGLFVQPTGETGFQQIAKRPFVNVGISSMTTQSWTVRLYALPVAQSGHFVHLRTAIGGVPTISAVYIRAIFTRNDIATEVLSWKLPLPTPFAPDLGDVTTWAPTPLLLTFTLDGEESSGWSLDVTHLSYLA